MTATRNEERAQRVLSLVHAATAHSPFTGSGVDQ
jgi:hypothetical protein